MEPWKPLWLCCAYCLHVCLVAEWKYDLNLVSCIFFCLWLSFKNQSTTSWTKKTRSLLSSELTHGQNLSKSLPRTPLYTCWRQNNCVLIFESRPRSPRTVSKTKTDCSPPGNFILNKHTHRPPIISAWK